MAPATITTASGATWQAIAQDRQRHRDATLAELDPPLPTSLPADVLDTTSVPAQILTANSDLEALISALASGKWSAQTVVRAFMRRAGLAQRLTNCVTELLPAAALSRAKELDAYLATHKRVVGPLHGVPVSVKEHVGMQGCDLNAGLVAWVGRVSEEDALILKILRDAGAVFYVRSTEPQSLMHIETSGNLYGTTVNPYNTTLSCGGSSGGEGALLGLRGSILGVGTDIGGSIRAPAANNGVFGFKPTPGRLPMSGLSATMAGADHISATTGPLATSLFGIELFVKTVLDARPWEREPTLVGMPWGSGVDIDYGRGEGRKLRVGVMRHDGVVRPHPPITAALAHVVERLRASEEVEVVEWESWKHDLAWEILAKLYFCDGGAETKAAIEESGEPYRPLTKWILLDHPQIREHSIASLWKGHQERDAYRAAYAALWNERQVDVILCPVGPGVAPKLGTGKYWMYTAQWNLLNYPAIAFPVGGAKVGDGEMKMAEHEYPADYTPLSEQDRFNYDLWKEHGAEGYKGAPVSLQLVGRNYEDEKLLKALGTLLDAAGLARTC
ncbi:amidase [Astrocystis sublimbata]|nr:amidase [Astrocystis sublimbata]